jgi:hypothetical protein
MDEQALQDEVYAYMEKMKGKKKLKEKDIIKKIMADHEGMEKLTVRDALRAMINTGKLMYSYGGGASSVEIPSEEYLREKGLIK